MSIDLNFWKYEKGTYLDNVTVYQRTCCDNEKVDGLELLPIKDILQEIKVRFGDWQSLDPLNYEKKDGQGAFQITTTPQTIRFDCYSMTQSDMKQFSSVLSKFQCPLYDPQQGVRYDKIAVFIDGTLARHQTLIEQKLSCSLPHLEIVTQIVDWDEYMRLSKELSCIHFNVLIHRGKSLTKVVSFMKFGNGWANRPCQCKNSQLDDPEKASHLLTELMEKSIERVINDFYEKTMLDNAR